MKCETNTVCAIALVLGGTIGNLSTASAASITYEGALSLPFDAVSGSVSGTGWADDDATGTDFWSFDVGAGGATLDIWALRSEPGLDTVFTVYAGTTTAEESEFMHLKDFGGMTVFKFADDQIMADGPFGDPALYSTLFPEGAYTIAVGGFLSGGDGPFSYKLSIGTPGSAPEQPIGPAVIPIPGAVWLFGSALLGLVGLGRNVSKKAS